VSATASSSTMLHLLELEVLPHTALFKILAPVHCPLAVLR
jgi:hypothetical protein